VHEARALLEQGHRVGDRLVIADAREGWDAAGLKALAAAAASGEPSAAIALFNRATPALAVIARGATGGIDAAAVLNSARPTCRLIAHAALGGAARSTRAPPRSSWSRPTRPPRATRWDCPDAVREQC
jgi:hypothetical protein